MSRFAASFSYLISDHHLSAQAPSEDLHADGKEYEALKSGERDSPKLGSTLGSALIPQLKLEAGKETDNRAKQRL